MTSSSEWWSRRWVGAVLIVLAVLAVYLPATRAGYVWDDDDYVTANRNLADTAGLARTWLEPRSSPQYYPLVFTSFWLERQVFGPGPLSHHVVNIALHAANAILLWLVLLQLRVPGAFLVALIFAVHPVQVESVAWITERKNVLSGFFCLAAMLAYLRRGSASYGLSLVLFALALLSKTVTATLPAVLLIVAWWQRGRIERRDVLRVLPMFALGAALAGLTLWLEVRHVGASGDEWTLSVPGRVLLAGRVAWFYAAKVLWPHPLVFVYPRWTVDVAAWWQSLFPLGVAAALLACWHWRGSIGRGPLAALMAFTVSLVPVLGFLDVYPMRYSYVADHFQYLPSVFVIVLAVAAGRHLTGRLGMRRVAAGVAAVLVVVLAVVARAETRKFQDLDSLWQDTIQKNPQSWIAWNNLGNLRMKEGRWKEAASTFETAIGLKPDLAEAHNNLGTALFYGGDTERAIESHRKAIRLKPSYAEALNNLGVELAAAGRHQEAMDFYRRALQARADYAMAHYNLANALVRTGQGEAAEAEYREAIRLDPGLAMAEYNLGVRLLARGDRSHAGPLLGDAFRLKPDFAAGYFEVGNILLRQGDAAAAAESYVRAIQRKPDFAEAYSNLGAALIRQGRVAEAITALAEAIRLKPGYAIAEYNLGSALEQAGRTQEAASHYEAALRLDPDNRQARDNLQRVSRALSRK